MVKAAKNVATAKMEAVATTFQELVLVHPDGEGLCKYIFISLTNVDRIANFICHYF